MQFKEIIAVYIDWESNETHKYKKESYELFKEVMHIVPNWLSRVN
jgi:hypothetical protein